MVAREAMAYGRPVIATAVGGLVDGVDAGVTGLLVAPLDTAGLRAALVRLTGDGDLRLRLGAAARERIRDRLSHDAYGESLLGVYHVVIGRSPEVSCRSS
jgi:glycosyltransferase involved in cell wall biosynthesis